MSQEEEEEEQQQQQKQMVDPRCTYVHAGKNYA
jgi:hypothetical protein